MDVMSTATRAPSSSTAAAAKGMKVQKKSSRVLLEMVVELVRNYDPATQTPDAYADDYFLSYGGRNSWSSSQEIFAREVLYGCVRRREGLKVFLTRLYGDMAARVLRSDYTFYMILSYLLLYRLRDVGGGGGFGEFKKLAEGLDPTKVCQLLEYLTDWDFLEEHLVQDLMAVYDLSYIRGDMLGGLRDFEDEISAYCGQLQFRAFGIKDEAQSELQRFEKKAAAVASSGGTLTKRGLTKPEPFNLTKPRPRKVPEPMRIDTRVVRSASPSFLRSTESVQDLEKRAEERRREIFERTLLKNKELHGGASQLDVFKRLSGGEDDRKRRLEQSRREAEEKLEKELTFSPQIPPPPRPVSESSKSLVKSNTSQLLREDALVKAIQARDASVIRAYEEDLRDATEFYRWQEEMKRKDEDEKLARVERVRQGAIESSLAARRVLAAQEAENSRRAQGVRRALAERRGLLREERERELSSKREAARNSLKKSREEPLKRMEAVKEVRKAKGRAVKAEVEAAISKERKVEKEREKARRAVVLKLKEHTVHKPFVKVFDPTTSAGLGLLGEMSLVETQERLRMNEIEREKEIERKRSLMEEERRRKKADLRRRKAAVAAMRSAARVEASEERQKRALGRTSSEVRLLAEKEERGMALLEVLEGRRREKLVLKQKLEYEEEERRKQAQYLGMAAAAVEEQAFDELLLGQERRVLRESARVVSEIQARQRVIELDKKLHAETQRRERAEKRRAMEIRKAEFQAAKERTVEKNRLEMVAKKRQVQTVRAREEALREATVLRRPYDATMTTTTST